LQVSNDKKVEVIAEYVKSQYEYPLWYDGTPSCGAKFYRYEKDASMKSFHWYNKVDYMWSFPAECVLQKLGICIDTSNLAETLLLAVEVKAKICLGAVYDTESNMLLGYHAWVEVPYKGEQYILETTIHPSGENLLPADVVYNKKMEIYYVKEAEYDDKEYKEVSQ